MPRKVIIDCDPGIDDLVTLAIALFDPRLEVLAVTACAGSVDAERAMLNLQTIVEQLDPPRHPRLGWGADPTGAPVSDDRYMHGRDGLGGLGLSPVSRQHLLSSDKVISDTLRTHPSEVSILCCGPLTAVASAFRRDPRLTKLVDRLFINGGCHLGPGDITPVAEFNMHFDPASAQEVFASATTKTLVPLDIASQLTFGLELLEQLPPTSSRVGRMLHGVLPAYFRAFRQYRAQEQVFFGGLPGLLAVTDPDLFENQDDHVEVETTGGLTRGMTVFDRRVFAAHRSNIELASGLDVEVARSCVLRFLRYAGQESREAG